VTVQWTVEEHRAPQGPRAYHYLSTDGFPGRSGRTVKQGDKVAGQNKREYKAY